MSDDKQKRDKPATTSTPPEPGARRETRSTTRTTPPPSSPSSSDSSKSPTSKTVSEDKTQRGSKQGNPTSRGDNTQGAKGSTAATRGKKASSKKRSSDTAKTIEGPVPKKTKQATEPGGVADDSGANKAGKKLILKTPEKAQAKGTSKSPKNPKSSEKKRRIPPIAAKSNQVVSIIAEEDTSGE